ncbi:MAG: hypothetical protein ABFS18_12950 [Thermodesulfobacteriota bacterium]
MSLVRFLSKEKLVEYLDEELRLFLNAKGIYELNQYGWLTDDRPDPEYIGLAMWQTEPPTSRNKITNIRETLLPPSFSQAEMGRIFKIGLQFEELMKSARHSIGLTHLFHKNETDLNQCFSYHFSDTVMKLEMATERLRDLFIEAFGVFLGFDIKDDDTSLPYSPAEQRHAFCRPFKKTRDKLAADPDQYEELLGCVDDLIMLVEQTPLKRVDELEQNNENFMTENNFSPTINGFNKRADSRKPQNSIPPEEPVPPSISEWYKLLVKESNQVFLAEYLLRNSDTHPPIPNAALSH